jgi:surfeit locus 1 family protein
VKRYLIFVIGFAAAAVFVRLGVWQLQRLGERRDRNAVMAERFAAPVVDLPTLDGRGDIDTFRFRRARTTGVFDFTREIVLTGRAHRGTPGVHLVTPLRLDDTVALLVERGWVFSPDGRTVEDPGAYLEPDAAEVAGVLLLPSVLPEAPGRGASWPHYARSIDWERLAPAYPYRLLPLVLRRTSIDDSLPAGMRGLARPELSGGPHLSYAIQWFAFAVIALVGSVLLYRRSGSDTIAREY